jgi:stearoyl-CoA desaturase (delta-9 desaturase)
VVWDLHLPPRVVVRGEQPLGKVVIEKVALELAGSYPVNQIASQVLDALARSPRWMELKTRLVSARAQAESFWSEIDLPQIPSLEEVRRYARVRLAHTPSLDDIAISARRRLLDLVHSRLVEAALDA